MTVVLRRVSVVVALVVSAWSVCQGHELLAVGSDVVIGDYKLIRLHSFLPTTSDSASDHHSPPLICSSSTHSAQDSFPPFLSERAGACPVILAKLLPDYDEDMLLGFEDGSDSYNFEAKFAQGAHGELWIARKIKNCQSNHEREAEFVLKRIFSSHLKRVALREIYFGRLLASKKVPRVAHLVEWFEKDDDLWVVYNNEGISLSEWIFARDEFGVRHLSNNWTNMKRKANGQEIIQILRDIIQAVTELHKLGITHRDIKSSNILVREEDGRLRAVLIDFSSAIDEESVRTLYGMYGPSTDEESPDYSPPEVIFSNVDGASGPPYFLSNPTSYDMWSVGVVFLEMILGTSKVFQVDTKTRAILEHKLSDQSEEVREKAILFRAMVEYCIYRLPSTDLGSSALTHASLCNETDLHKSVLKWDPLGLGVPGGSMDRSQWCLRLLRRLLEYDPRHRISAEESGHHACFKGPSKCSVCGAEFESDEAWQSHSMKHPQF